LKKLHWIRVPLIFIVGVVLIHGIFDCWWTHADLPPGYALRTNGNCYRYYNSNSFLFCDEWGSHWTKRGAIGAAWFDKHWKDRDASKPEWKPIE